MSALNIFTGISVFRKLRKKGFYYVDKTDFISEFLTSMTSEVSLITRPRRFGKSLTMSMLADFFDNQQESSDIFAGLKISEDKELCEQWMNKWPVIYLKLKRVESPSFSESLKQISRVVSYTVRQHSYVFQSDVLDEDQKNELAELKKGTEDRELLESSLELLSIALYLIHKKEVIVLIDEYDVPMAKAQENSYYDQMVCFMRNMLGNVLKDNEYLKFGVLTGCLRLAKESSYTGLNNIKCYGMLSNKFADKIGFTSNDVDKLLSDADLLCKKDEIREWYDGYCFGNNHEIYCPWDVLHFIDDIQSKNILYPSSYWVNSGGNDEIMRCIRNNNKNIRNKLHTLINNGTINAKINETLTYDTLDATEDNIWTLLYLTGYLTKCDTVQEKAAQGEYTLCIPNKEISIVFTANINLWFRRIINNLDLHVFLDAFWNGDDKAVTESLSSVILKTLSCFDVYKEHYYHALLTGIFYCQAYEVTSNSECGYGFSDLLVIDTDNNRTAVIEIKQSKDIKKLNTLPDQALQQINDKQYSFPYKDEQGTVIHWGFGFCLKHFLAKSEFPCS